MSKSEKFEVFRYNSHLDKSNIVYRKYENLWDVRYKGPTNKRSKAIYIQTPALELSSIEEDDQNYYLIYKVDIEKNSDFCDLMLNLDMALLEEMCGDKEFWNYRENTPINFIERHLMPVVRMSSTNYEYSLYLTVHKLDDISVFDENKHPLEVNQLNAGSNMILLLLLDGVVYEKGMFNIKMNLEQAKLVPEPVLPPTVPEPLPEPTLPPTQSEPVEEPTSTSAPTPEQVPAPIPEPEPESEPEPAEPSKEQYLLGESDEEDNVTVAPKETHKRHKFSRLPKKEAYGSDNEDLDV